MKNARPGFVIDPYRFDGSFLTSMSDGIHCDYTHKTLEELRAGEDNPRLVTVSRNTADKMFRIHLKSKCLPFKEITESQYYENMDMLPPVRHTRNFFFIGEPCFRDLYTFCFHVEGRYFTGLRSVTTPRKELERQMEGHYRSLTFRGGVTKGPACAITGKTNRQYLLTPYFFTDTDGEKNSSATWSPAQMKSRISEAQEKTWRKSCSAYAAIISSISPHTRGGMIWKSFWKRQKTKAHPAGKRKTAPVSHEPGVRIIYRNSQGNARAVLLPDL